MKANEGVPQALLYYSATNKCHHNVSLLGNIFNLLDGNLDLSAKFSTSVDCPKASWTEDDGMTAFIKFIDELKFQFYFI